MVFYKKQYRNVRSAMENSDGLCVLAFFFHVRFIKIIVSCHSRGIDERQSMDICGA